IVPRSTTASRDGSMSEAPFRVAKPATTPMTRMAEPTPTHTTRRDFLVGDLIQNDYESRGREVLAGLRSGRPRPAIVRLRAPKLCSNESSFGFQRVSAVFSAKIPRGVDLGGWRAGRWDAPFSSQTWCGQDGGARSAGRFYRRCRARLPPALPTRSRR